LLFEILNRDLSYLAWRSPIGSSTNQKRHESGTKADQKRITLGNQRSEVNQKRIKSGSKANQTRHGSEPLESFLAQPVAITQDRSAKTQFLGEPGEWTHFK
jgi:hypothetical protein